MKIKKVLLITTLEGKVEKRARVADAICKAAGKSIPIYAGADHTMLPSPIYPTPEGAVKLSNWEHDSAFYPNRAFDSMRKTIHDNPGEISLLAIGGHLTNVALLFLVDPESAMLIKELYIMSSVFSDALKVDMDIPIANWNSWLVSYASAVVYHTKVPMCKTFGLNVTTHLVLKKIRNPFILILF